MCSVGVEAVLSGGRAVNRADVYFPGCFRMRNWNLTFNHGGEGERRKCR